MESIGATFVAMFLIVFAIVIVGFKVWRMINEDFTALPVNYYKSSGSYVKSFGQLYEADSDNDEIVNNDCPPQGFVLPAELQTRRVHRGVQGPSPSPTQGPSPSPSPSPLPTQGTSPSPSPLPTQGPSPSPSPTPTPTQGPSPSPTQGPSPSPTPTQGPSPSPTPTQGPSPSPKTCQYVGDSDNIKPTKAVHDSMKKQIVGKKKYDDTNELIARTIAQRLLCRACSSSTTPPTISDADKSTIQGSSKKVDFVTIADTNLNSKVLAGNVKINNILKNAATISVGIATTASTTNNNMTNITKTDTTIIVFIYS